MAQTRDSLYSALILGKHTGMALLVDMLEDDAKIMGEEFFAIPDKKELNKAVDEAVFSLEEHTSLYSDNLIIFSSSELLDTQTLSMPPDLLASYTKLSKDLQFTPHGVIQVHEAFDKYYGKRPDTLFIEVSRSSMVFLFPNEKHQALRLATEDWSSASLTEYINDAIGYYKKQPKTIFLYTIDSDITLDVDTIDWVGALGYEPLTVFLSSQELKKILIRMFYEELMGTTKKQDQVPVVPVVAPILTKEEQKEKIVEEPLVKPDLEKEQIPKRVHVLPIGFTAEPLVAVTPILATEPIVPIKQTLAPPVPPEPIMYDRVHEVAPVESEFEDEEYEEQPEAPKKRFPIWKGRISWIPFAIAAFGLLLLIGASYIYEQFLHKAVVVVPLATTPVEKEITISTSKNPELFLSNGTDTFEEAKTVQTTGSTNIGQKAKGEVSIFNLDSKPVTFVMSGTKLISKGKTYLITKNITIASASAETINGVPARKAGEGKITIEAQDIGPEYNVSKNTEFGINEASTAQYFARANTDIAGGVKSAVTAVSKADIENARSAALSAIADKMSITKDGYEILSDLTSVKTVSESVNPAIDQEATQVTVSIKQSASYVGYNKGLVEAEIIKQLEQDPTAVGKKMTGSGVSIEKKQVSKGKSDVQVVFTAKAKFIETKDKASTIQGLVGKKISELSHVIVQKNNALPFFTDTLPSKAKNIELTFSEE